MSMIGNFLAIPPDTLKFLIDNPSAIPDFLDEGEDGSDTKLYLDVDKAWHGIHFLLTRDAWGGEGLLASVVLGGTPIGEDVGYGPARYLTSDEVKLVNTALAQLFRDALVNAYSPSAFLAAKIYPSGIWEHEGDDALRYILDYFDELVIFYADASARGDAMLLYIN